MIEYTQDEWDSLSDNQKGLYLSNKERVDRGIAPYAAVARQVSDVAQDYATYLLEVEETLAHETTDAKWTGSGRDASFCCDPYDRLAAALGDEKEFFRFSENLAWASAGTASTFPEPVAYSVYAWIYDDSGSSWGHRHFSLAELNDNAGEANLEGLAGFGVARGAGGTYTVMNVADEAAGWDHASDSNIVLWSSMVGGADGTNGDAPASDPSPSPSDPSPSPSEDSGANGGLIAAIVVVVATLTKYPDRVRDVAARAVRSRGLLCAHHQSRRRRGAVSCRLQSAAIVAQVQLPRTARARRGERSAKTTRLLRAV